MLKYKMQKVWLKTVINYNVTLRIYHIALKIEMTKQLTVARRKVAKSNSFSLRNTGTALHP